MFETLNVRNFDLLNFWKLYIWRVFETLKFGFFKSVYRVFEVVRTGQASVAILAQDFFIVQFFIPPLQCSGGRTMPKLKYPAFEIDDLDELVPALEKIFENGPIEYNGTGRDMADLGSLDLVREGLLMLQEKILVSMSC